MYMYNPNAAAAQQAVTTTDFRQKSYMPIFGEKWIYKKKIVLHEKLREINIFLFMYKTMVLKCHITELLAEAPIAQDSTSVFYVVYS